MTGTPFGEGGDGISKREESLKYETEEIWSVESIDSLLREIMVTVLR